MLKAEVKNTHNLIKFDHDTITWMQITKNKLHLKFKPATPAAEIYLCPTVLKQITSKIMQFISCNTITKQITRSCDIFIIKSLRHCFTFSLSMQRR